MITFTESFRQSISGTRKPSDAVPLFAASLVIFSRKRRVRLEQCAIGLVKVFILEGHVDIA